MNDLKWNWIWKPRLDLFTRIALWVTIVVLLCFLSIAIGAKYTFAEEDSYLKMYTDGIYCTKDTNCKEMYDKKVTCYEPDDVAKLSQEDQDKYNDFYRFVEAKGKNGICGYIAYKPTTGYSLSEVTKKIQDDNKAPTSTVCAFTQDDLEEMKDYYKTLIDEQEALSDEQEQTIEDQETFIYQCESERKVLQNANNAISTNLSRVSIELNESKYLFSLNTGRGSKISPLLVALILCGILCMGSLYLNFKQWRKSVKHNKNASKQQEKYGENYEFIKKEYNRLKLRLEETENGISGIRKKAQVERGKIK